MKRALGMLLPLALLVAGCGGARLASNRSVSVDAAAAYAERVAGAAHVFAGVRVHYPERGSVFVQLTHPPAAVIDRLSARYPGVYVFQTGLPRTLSQIRALQHSVTASLRPAKGIDVVDTYARDGRLQVGVTSNVATAQAFFDRKYGRGAIHVGHADKVGLPDAWGSTGNTRHVPTTLDPATYAKRVAGVSRYFAGVVDESGTYTVHLNLVHAPRAIVHRLLTAYPDTFVINNDAPRSWGFVLHLQRVLLRRSLAARGIDMVESNPTQNGRLRVGVTSSVRAAQAYFDQKYGRGVILVSHAEPGSMIGTYNG